MSLAYACHVCDTPDYRWRISRRGDAVVSWACAEHLVQVCQELQRSWESTELVLTERKERPRE